jgi:hypothetical protein
MLAMVIHRSGFGRLISQPEISLFEIGRLVPRPDELEAMGRALGVEPASALLKEVQPDSQPEVAQ